MAVMREMTVSCRGQAATLLLLFGPTSLCTNAPSPQKSGIERSFVFERRGRLYTG